MLKQVGNVLEESSLILMVDLGKLTEKLAAVFNRHWRSTLIVQIKDKPAFIGHEVLTDRPRTDAEVCFHQLEDSGVDTESVHQVRVAVEQVAASYGPTKQTE